MVEAIDLQVLQRVAERSARKLTRNFHDQQDIAQAALLRAWKVAQQGKDPRIVSHAAKWGAIDAMRKLRGRRPRPRMESLDHDPADLRSRLRELTAELREIRHRLPLPKVRTLTPRRGAAVDAEAVARIVPLATVIRDAQRQALVATGLNVKQAAQALGIGRATLYRAIQADPALLTALEPRAPTP